VGLINNVPLSLYSLRLSADATIVGTVFRLGPLGHPIGANFRREYQIRNTLSTVSRTSDTILPLCIEPADFIRNKLYRSKGHARYVTRWSRVKPPVASSVSYLRDTLWRAVPRHMNSGHPVASFASFHLLQLESVKIWGVYRTNHRSIAFMQSGLIATRLADNSPRCVSDIFFTDIVCTPCRPFIGGYFGVPQTGWPTL
jgi:hypothetical protein